MGGSADEREQRINLIGRASNDPGCVPAWLTGYAHRAGYRTRAELHAGWRPVKSCTGSRRRRLYMAPDRSVTGVFFCTANSTMRAESEKHANCAPPASRSLLLAQLR